MVQANRSVLGIRLHIDVDDRKVVYHTECLDCIVPLTYQPVRIYRTFGLAPVKRLSIDRKGIVRQNAFLGHIPAGIPLKILLVGRSVPVASLLVCV